MHAIVVALLMALSTTASATDWKLDCPAQLSTAQSVAGAVPEGNRLADQMEPADLLVGVAAVTGRQTHGLRKAESALPGSQGVLADARTGRYGRHAPERGLFAAWRSLRPASVHLRHAGLQPLPGRANARLCR